MLLLRNYFNLLTMMSTSSSDSSDSALPLNEEEAMKNAEMEQKRHTEKLKKWIFCLKLRIPEQTLK